MDGDWYIGVSLHQPTRVVTFNLAGQLGARLPPISRALCEGRGGEGRGGPGPGRE